MPLPLPTADESSLRLLIDAARSGIHEPDEIAELARHLAASGTELDWPSSAATADIASTGGPGSLSTLLAPIALAASGCSVVKLAVPGRPAGAIDAMGTVPGYRTRLSVDEVRDVVAGAGFAHFLADERFAPLDAQLFALRKRVDAVAVPTLAIASLLSKKIAVGVRRVGLDVRVGRHGNLGVTLEAARENARMFCRVAKLVGIEAVAFLSRQDQAPQPWIGRGESLIALASALGVLPLADSWLEEHVANCLRMASEIASPSRPLLDVLEQHLRAQGSSMHHFQARLDELAIAERVELRIQSEGRLYIDLRTVRDVIVAEQADNGMGFRDPLGVCLRVRPGEHVSAGDVVASVRGADSVSLARLAVAFSVGDNAPPGPTSMEIVHA